MKSDIRTALAAACPLIEVDTVEEEKGRIEIQAAADDEELDLWLWFATKGFIRASGGTGEVKADCKHPLKALAFIEQNEDPSVYVMHDFRYYWKDPVIVRAVRDLIPTLKGIPSTIAFLGTQLNAPPELSHEVHKVEIDLPGTKELKRMLHGIVENAEDAELNSLLKDDELVIALANAARGMTRSEAEKAFALATVEGMLDPKSIWKLKARALASDELKIRVTDITMANVGGLNRVKEWARKRRKSFTKAAREYGLEDVRGVLVVGPQGTGKSLVAEAIAAEWETPLYEFNLSACRKSLVGQSGATLRSVFKRMKGTGRACLRMDEIDKAVPSASNGAMQGDSGVGQSMKGELLTWMNDHTDPVTVIGTANDIRNIDAALFRPGRVDTIFFVDLPTLAERIEIFKIHCEKEGRAHSIEISDLGYLNAAEESVGFVGAEIEQAVKDAMIEAFDAGRSVTIEDLLTAVRDITPSGETFGDQLEYIRQFKSKVKPASDPEPAKANGGRKVRRNKRN